MADTGANDLMAGKVLHVAAILVERRARINALGCRALEAHAMNYRAKQ
jgi:hypothetical protein